MSIVQSYETFTGRQIFTFRLVDQFAYILGTRGSYPPPIGPISVLVTERTDIGRIYEPERVLVTWPNATGCLLTGGDLLPTNSGDPSLPLARGDYKMRIESDYYLPDEFGVAWPLAGVKEVDLFPTAAYPFPDLTVNPVGTEVTITRGCLFESDGTPNAGVDVSVAIEEPDSTLPPGWPFADAKTSEKGEWVLVLPDQREMFDPPPDHLLTSIHVQYTIDGDVFHEEVQAGRENRFVQASLRGSAVDRGGRALAGVIVENSLQPGASITGRDGRWSIYLPLSQTDAACTVKATDPDGHVLSGNTNVLAHKTVIVERFQFL